MLKALGLILNTAKEKKIVKACLMGKVCKEDSKVSISPHLFFLDECHHKSHIPGKFQSNWWM